MAPQPASSPTAPKSNDGTEGRALLGFMEAPEAAAFLRGQCHAGNATDSDLRAMHEAARAAAAQGPAPAEPEVLELDPRHAEYLAKVAASPDMAEIAEGRPWSFKRVEIDRMVAFQKFVDADRGLELASFVDFENPDSVLAFCLPRERPRRNVIQSFDARENAFTLMAPGQDLRLLGNASLELPGKKRVVGFVPGFGIPHVQVVHYQDRYYLKNGYHRLYQLRANGVRHAPCIVVEAAAFTTTGAARDGFFPESLLVSQRPPTMADFLHPTISPPVRLRPWTKLIRIRAEEIKVPAELSVPAPPPLPAAQPSPAAPTAPAPPTPGFEDFAVAREGWNSYRLEDGTLLKVRQFLVRIPTNVVPGVPDVQFGLEASNPIIATFPPAALRGPPGGPDLPAPELEKSVVQDGLKHEVLHETQNEYVCSNGTRVQLALKLGRVARTSRFTGFGDPVYIISTETALNVLPAIAPTAPA